MNQTLECPLLGLELEFPDQVWLLRHEPSGKYACFCYHDVHGLASFSHECGAIGFAETLDMPGLSTELVTFDEAREVAKARPLPVISLMLLDNIEDPKIHYIR